MNEEDRLAAEKFEREQEEMMAKQKAEREAKAKADADKAFAKRTKDMNADELKFYTEQYNNFKNSGEGDYKDWLTKSDLAYGNYKRGENMTSEEAVTNSQIAEEEGASPEVQAVVDKAAINAGAKPEQLKPQENPEPPKPTPEPTPKTETNTVGSNVQIQQQATETAKQRLANKLGMSEEDAQAYLDAFVKGKMPPGSKGYFIGNAIATTAQNIANQLAASEYNNRWSSIRNGSHIDPEMQTTAWQDYKNNQLKQMQDIMAESASEDAIKSKQIANQQSQANLEGTQYENVVKKYQALSAEEASQIDMEMKKAGLDAQKLANESQRLNNMNLQERSKYFADLAKLDYDTAKATLTSLKFGGANLSVKLPGFSGETDLATLANVGGEVWDKAKKALGDM